MTESLKAYNWRRLTKSTENIDKMNKMINKVLNKDKTFSKKEIAYALDVRQDTLSKKLNKNYHNWKWTRRDVEVIERKYGISIISTILKQENKNNDI